MPSQYLMKPNLCTEKRKSGNEIPVTPISGLCMKGKRQVHSSAILLIQQGTLRKKGTETVSPGVLLLQMAPFFPKVGPFF